MQQRRLRLGDILDDYCPRERRITDHAVVAMIDEEVKQTRCTACDDDHEYRHAQAPPQRRRKLEAAESASLLRPGALADQAAEAESIPQVASPSEGLEPPPEPLEGAETLADEPRAADEEGPVHRRLIRATLPRPDGQLPERKTPDFTVRQPGVRGLDGQRNGGRRRPVHAQGNAQPQRFGGPRPGAGGPRPGSGHGQRQGGYRAGPPGGPRGRGGRKRGR